MLDTDRFHSLDAVRGFALLLGIVFHATISFTPAAPLLIGWPLVDNSPSATLSAVFYVLHIFRMTTFFVVAGFFARLLLHRYGIQGFIRNRRKRILIPLLVSWPIVMSLFVLVIMWMFAKLGLRPVPPKLPHPVLLVFPLGHLWFLYMLLLLYVTVLSLRWLANRVIDRDGRIRSSLDRVVANMISTPIFPVLLALPLMCALFLTPWWNFWIGIPTPDNTLIPNAPAFIGYATAMMFGWFLHRQQGLLARMTNRWMLFAGLAVVLTVVSYWMVGMPSVPITLTTDMRALYSFSYATATWCWTFAILGAAVTYWSKENATRRYIADSSYWMYLMHMPIVFALQIWMMDWPLQWTIKYPLILAITFSILLVSYHYWVRPTFIGQALNGRRYPRSSASLGVGVNV